MEPTLHTQETTVVDKWTYLFRAPQRGDVIVFIAPPQPDQDYVKRIIAVPGDTISIENGTPIVNTIPLKEFYVDPRLRGKSSTDQEITNIIVPPDMYFVLGDNRINSSDSRTWGFVPQQNILGRVAFVSWPLGENNDGPLPETSPVFSQIP